ncbi:MAG: hypothetical protein OXE80_01430 [Gammaproteobacteria bacterium]|nr:hypothetical protein [Gammaproteobacteria bacterium]MCY4183548.1 hypothetical protein [Gammaproteobacteria bacterium]MCY4268820.1 hypothetical protein [Gammaproteobacteria bacterium]MCY4297159.1 hypothetical protein [Gammaproteobacteria bacterium]
MNLAEDGWSVLGAFLKKQEIAMENAFSIGVVVGSPLLALVATTFLPKAVWNSNSGLYRGYVNKSVVSIMAVVVIFFGFVAIQTNRPGPDAVAYVLATMFLALGLSRLAVELYHHHKFGIWLHKQYHKLTDHDEPG